MPLNGPAKRQLLRGLLLGPHESDVCGRGDEPALDGHYRRLRPCGESGSRRPRSEPGIRSFVYRMGDVDVGGSTGLTLTVWFR